MTPPAKRVFRESRERRTSLGSRLETAERQLQTPKRRNGSDDGLPLHWSYDL